MTTSLPGWPTLLAFVLAVLVTTAVPGPNVVYIIGTGIGSGRPTAVAAALGVEAGTLVHVAASVLGLSALLSSSAVAFSVVRYAGVAYLLWLAWHALRNGRAAAESVVVGFGRAFRRGMLVNVLNPKVSLFFLAFLPQFVEPAATNPAAQILLLGMVLFAIALVVDLAYAAGSGSLGWWLSRRPRLARRQSQLAGVVYLALAAAAAVGGGRREPMTAAGS